ncbi:Terpene cyclase ascF [Paramyrothecium foliicola]|nr:Terpene cyclase ascF [Paramyrothecium foliicola]
MRRLADYVEAIHFQGAAPTTASCRPFNSKSPRDSPMLQPGVVNRILLFPGAFNPPHKGHLELLSFVYSNAGADLNVVAAIVIPTDDSKLRLKTSEEKRPLVLSKEQRVSSWNNSGIPKDCVWIYDRSEQSWHDFRQRLEAKVKADEIDLKFIFLGGPDYIGYKALYDPASWGCVDVITSDISRLVDFRCPYSMRQLPGCGPWVGVNYNPSRVERLIRGKLRGESKKVIEEAVARAHSVIRAAWVCRETKQPRGYIRFVPCCLESRHEIAPSSTAIRQCITTSPQEELEAKLAELALSPAMLLGFLQEAERASISVMGLTDVPPPEAPWWLVLASTACLGVGVGGWLVAYALMTLRSLSTHHMPVPLIPLGLNIAWEVVYALYVSETLLEKAGFLLWLLLDMAVLYATLRAVPQSFAGAPLVARNFIPILGVVFLLGLVGNAYFAAWWMAEPHRGHGLKWGKSWNGHEARDATELAWWTAGFAQAAFSVGALAMLFQRGHSGGQSYAIWWVPNFSFTKLPCIYEVQGSAVATTRLLFARGVSSSA